MLPRLLLYCVIFFVSVAAFPRALFSLSLPTLTTNSPLSPSTCSEGGFFKAHLHFPKEYPLRPPRMKFVTEIWHPNIEKNGDVCISILHEPGDDKWGYEKASERWLPVHTVETILISVISMLADPNDESPANVDAAKEWREAYPDFKRKVARCVRKSQEEC